MLYRERLRAILLERDEAEAHRKAWDTRGRGPTDADEKAMARLSHTDKGFRKLRESDLAERDLVHTGVLKDGTSYRIYGRRGSYTIRHTPTLDEIGVAYVNDKRDATDADHYMSSVRLEPKFQKQGIANALYDAIERTAGKPLLPSPTYQSPQAKRFWEKRKARKVNLSAFDLQTREAALKAWDTRGRKEEVALLAKQASKNLRAYDLERDEAAIHKKAWDTRGRNADKERSGEKKSKKPAGHNVTRVSGDASDALEVSLIGEADGAEAFAKAMLEDLDVDNLTFTVDIQSGGGSGGGGISDEFRDEYDEYVNAEQERLREDHYETQSDEHGTAMREALSEVEDLWDSFSVVQEQVSEIDHDTPTLPVDPPFERPEVTHDAVGQMFRELRVDLDRPARASRLLDNEKISAYLREHPENFAGRIFPSFDEDTVREWSDKEGGYWGENSGFDNWVNSGEASEPDYDSIESYDDWYRSQGYDESIDDDDDGSIKWVMRGSDGTRIERSLYMNDRGEKEAHHDWFETPKSGIGKDVMRGMVREYERVGVEKVTVHAGLSQGGYAWARYGFLPDNPRDIQGQVEYRLGRLGGTSINPLSSDEVSAVRKVISDNDGDPKLLWKISDMRIGDRKIGHELLAGSNWHGTFDMKNPEQMARFKQYVGKPKHERDEAEAHKKAWDTRGRDPSAEATSERAKAKTGVVG